ncbi:CD276 antigen-like [Mustelus asterias]
MFQHSESSYFLVMMILKTALLSDQLQVSTWKETILAIHDQQTVLPCRFFGDFSSNMVKILWQHVETKEILWSYYQGQDQLNQQSWRYSGRVSVFPKELKWGNASLKLEQVNSKDAGQYMCSIRTPAEKSTGIVSVMFAAYYTEPSLTIKQTSNGTTFIFESRGFPKAAAYWYDAQHQDISALSKTLCQLDEDGLYSLQSALQVSDTSVSSNYMFTLMNDVLQQNISRILGPPLDTEKRNHWCVVVAIISYLAFMLILARIYKRSVPPE